MPKNYCRKFYPICISLFLHIAVQSSHRNFSRIYFFNGAVCTFHQKFPAGVDSSCDSLVRIVLIQHTYRLVQIPDEKEDILREGEWNTLRLKVQGDRVQTWLNGEEMVDITDARIGAAQGRIALQIHDGGGIKVLWRNFRLTTL